MKIISILIAILMFSIIVIFHELGHFLLAKANGIRVNEFSLGLGPTLFGFKKGETLYSLKLLPFGGACAMEGEDESSEDERAFNNKPVLARMSVVFAGPFFNFIMAFVFSLILIGANGYDKPVLSAATNGYPAQEAGLKAGDEILKLNHFRVHFFNEINYYAVFHPGETVDVTYQRDGKTLHAQVKPTFNKKENRYLYGFQGSGEKYHGNVGEVITHSFYEVRRWIYVTIQSLRMLVTGGAGFNDLSGPVGIVSNVGSTYVQAVQQSGWVTGFLTVLTWAILLSANLGVMNLLPLPALDGGRLVFLIIEAIRRKPVPREKEGWVHAVGIVLLLGLMVVVMFNDIRKFFV